MTTLIKRRSNRPLTEFACSCLEDFILTKNVDSYQAIQKNTTVRVLIDKNIKVFTVFLYEEEIFRITLSQNKAISVKLSFTSFFDGYGQPSSTTAERLNGLLDTIGVLGVIPQGVRVFRDQEYYTTYVGKGDEKVAIGKGLFSAVYIKPDTKDLVFSGFESSIKQENEEHA